MFVLGPYINKQVVKEHRCLCGHVHERTENVFDVDQYWRLDWQGDEDTDNGGFFYAKLAYPKLRDAQRQHRLDKEARDADRARGRKANREAARRRRQRAPS